MPAAEVASYELAFHILPTVAEGEVAGVVMSLKEAIANASGSITNEEAPARFELAYDIVKHIEGRNRTFSSAYFGWLRFTLEPSQLAGVVEVVEAHAQLLRHLCIRLNKVEEAEPFFFHEALASKQSETVEIDDMAEEAETLAKDDTDVEETEESDESDESVDSSAVETEVRDDSVTTETEVK